MTITTDSGWNSSVRVMEAAANQTPDERDPAMPDTMPLLARTGAALAAVTLVLGTAAPALAGPPADRGRDRGATTTEDTDDNDGGTPDDVADAGDDAHPSGRDRSVEPGRSGSQGAAASDPDDDGRGPDRSNGGVDRPGGDGGVDQADQDGNNGCGNDDDFEDDNEGLCLGRDRAPGQQPDATTPPAAPAPDDDLLAPGSDDDGVVEEGRDDEEEDGESAPVPGPTDGDTEGTEVLGNVVVADRTPAAAPEVEAEVLGNVVTRQLGALGAAADTSAAATGELPRTGVALGVLAVLGLALAGIGALVTKLGGAEDAG